jgi:hypothetical protein
MTLSGCGGPIRHLWLAAGHAAVFRASGTLLRLKRPGADTNLAVTTVR